MMRQYELVDRVRQYNPNADEDLLNRAYVYAMKAHGAQKRASGDPYFMVGAARAALRNLGLNLESTRGPGEFLVVDHIERPFGN